MQYVIIFFIGIYILFSCDGGGGTKTTTSDISKLSKIEYSRAMSLACPTDEDLSKAIRFVSQNNNVLGALVAYPQCKIMPEGAKIITVYPEHGLESRKVTYVDLGNHKQTMYVLESQL